MKFNIIGRGLLVLVKSVVGLPVELPPCALVLQANGSLVCFSLYISAFIGLLFSAVGFRRGGGLCGVNATKGAACMEFSIPKCRVLLKPLCIVVFNASSFFLRRGRTRVAIIWINLKKNSRTLLPTRKEVVSTNREETANSKIWFLTMWSYRYEYSPRRGFPSSAPLSNPS